MLSVGLALSAAGLWGVADFLAALQSRRISPLVVTVVSQGTGAVVLLIGLSLASPAPPLAGDVAIAALAGLATAVALTAFYAAMARGKISVVAPIVSTGIAIPVLLAIAGGDRPETLGLLGIAAAGGGVLLASRARAEGGARQPVVIALALVSAFALGWFYVAMDAAADQPLLWVLFGARLTTVAALATALLVARPSLRIPASSLRAVVGVGLADLAATACFVVATTHGHLSVVSVLVSLYAIATILLARIFLSERVARVQRLGIAFALVGVGLIAATA